MSGSWIGGKGSKRRKEDPKKFSEGFDLIWGKKKQEQKKPKKG